MKSKDEEPHRTRTKDPGVKPYMIDELNCAKCKKLTSKSESLQEVSTLQFQIIGGLNERKGGGGWGGEGVQQIT